MSYKTNFPSGPQKPGRRKGAPPSRPPTVVPAPLARFSELQPGLWLQWLDRFGGTREGTAWVFAVHGYPPAARSWYLVEACDGGLAWVDETSVRAARWVREPRE